MRHNRVAVSIAILITIALAASSAFSAHAVTNSPTSDTQTLMSRLSPENATLGQTISWLIWTDPSLPGKTVTLTITDLTNDTIIYQSDKALNSTTGTNSYSGAYQLLVNTAAYKQHRYSFTANTTSGNMNMESTRYEDFVPKAAPKLEILGVVSPYVAIPGDTLNLTILEFNYPDVAATMNITLTNSTKPSLQSWTNEAIPASNGSRVLKVSTTGLKAGSYEFKINATSAIGKDDVTAGFELKDIIILVDSEVYNSYFIGDQVNVSIRTYTAVTQSGLSITYTNFITTPPYIQTGKVIDTQVTLTGGRYSHPYLSASWKPSSSYQARGNATVASKNVQDTCYFSLEAFTVSVDTDKDEYLAGQTVNITTVTTPKQAGAQFTLTVTNSTHNVMYASGTSSLRSDGAAVNLVNTNNWPVDSYTAKASVTSTIQGTQYVVNDTNTFDIYARTFNIYAKLSSTTVSGYVMPTLNVTTVGGQTNANLTITITHSASTEYVFTKTLFSISQYQYMLPLPEAPNGSRTIKVQVDSPVGTNSTSTSLYYTHGTEIIVSEPFLLQALLLLGSSPLFYYGIRRRRRSSAYEET